MWILAGALWCAFKWVSYACDGGTLRVSPIFFAWVGMDPAPFRRDCPKVVGPVPRLRAPLLFMAGGAFLLVVAIPLTDSPVLVGSIGMVAMVCVLHFGLFDLMATCWNRFGFPVQPIMKSPWMATSLGEFWGERWNRAFSDWARRHVFRPFVRRCGVISGTMSGFLVSGLAHELVISLPAKACWGFPTLYFLLQGGLLLMQKEHECLRGKWPTLAMVILPAPLLFHPPFLTDVMAPMIRVLVGRV